MAAVFIVILMVIMTRSGQTGTPVLKLPLERQSLRRITSSTPRIYAVSTLPVTCSYSARGLHKRRYLQRLFPTPFPLPPPPSTTPTPIHTDTGLAKGTLYSRKLFLSPKLSSITLYPQCSSVLSNIDLRSRPVQAPAIALAATKIQPRDSQSTKK